MKSYFFLITKIFLFVIVISGCVDFGINSHPAPVLNLGINSDSKTGAIIVRAGDNLWSISKRYRLPIRAIIALNNIRSPYALSKGKRLKLPAPIDYRVKRGDTLYSIANMFDVSVYKMVRLNKIRQPYRIRIGQRLRMPSSLSTKYYSKKTHYKKRRISRSNKKYRSRKRKHKRRVATIKDSRRPNFIWPVKGKIISRYGAKKGGLYNDGINIAVPKRTPVLSSANGIVAYIGDDLKSYGNLVLIRHSGGMTTAYAHLRSIKVKKGEKVRKRQVIGIAGSTGSVPSPQLHFEIRKGAKTYNPVRYL